MKRSASVLRSSAFSKLTTGRGDVVLHSFTTRAS